MRRRAFEPPRPSEAPPTVEIAPPPSWAARPSRCPSRPSAVRRAPVVLFASVLLLAFAQRGLGFYAGGLDVDPLFLVFDKAGTGTSQTLTVRNAIEDVTVATSFTVEGPYASDFQIWVKEGDIRSMKPNDTAVVGIKLKSPVPSGATIITGELMVNMDGVPVVSVGLIGDTSPYKQDVLSGPDWIVMGQVLPTGEFSQGAVDSVKLEVVDGAKDVTVDTITYFGADGFKMKLLSENPAAKPLVGPLAVEGFTSEKGANVALKPGGIIKMQIHFEGEEMGTKHACFGLSGRLVRTKLVCALATVVDHVNLHPVVDVPVVTVDYDGDGKENVTLNGGRSHTHEQSSEYRFDVVKWVWKVDGEWVYEGKNSTADVDVLVGDHMAVMTIYDDDTPAKHITDALPFHVVSPSRIPGPQVYLYASAKTPFSILALPAYELPDPDWISSSVEQFDIEVEPVNKEIAGSPMSENVMARAVGNVLIDEVLAPNETVTISADGAPAYVYVNGKSVDMNVPVELEYGRHVFDVRFAVTDKALFLALKINYDEVAVFGPERELLVTRDETDIPPFINRIEPDIGHKDKPNNITISGVGFIMPGDAGHVVVNWSGQKIFPSDVTSGSVTFIAPPKQEVGADQVSITTSRGTSNVKTFQSVEHVKPAIKWQESVTAYTEGGPTGASWGPDAKLYVGTVAGNIHVIDFNPDYTYRNHTVITSLQDHFGGNQSILGIQVDPYSDAAEPSVYVSHGHIYPKGPGCERTIKEGLEFNGKISRLYGPNLTLVEEKISNLTCTNGDLCVNHPRFDLDGDLFWGQASASNGGPPSCYFGAMEESPLSAAVLKAEIRRSDFNGKLKYVWKDNAKSKGPAGSPAPNDQRWASLYDIDESVVGITTWSVGFHNPFGLEYTTDGELWATSNGASAGLGPTFDIDSVDAMLENYANCPYPQCTPNETVANSRDRVHGPLFKDSYWGYPNPNRAQDDPRQWYFFPSDYPPKPDVYTQGLTVPSSVDGIAQFRGTCFEGQLKDDLVALQWNVAAWRVDRPDAPGEVTKVSKLTDKIWALGLEYGPGCALVGADFSDNRLEILLPDDESATLSTDPQVWDLTNWRGNPTFDLKLMVGGVNFVAEGRKPTQVAIGGQPCEITDYGAIRIDCTLAKPVGEVPGGWLDAEVWFSDGKYGKVSSAFIYIDPEWFRWNCFDKHPNCKECWEGRCVICQEGFDLTPTDNRCAKKGVPIMEIEGVQDIDPDGLTFTKTEEELLEGISAEEADTPPAPTAAEDALASPETAAITSTEQQPQQQQQLQLQLQPEEPAISEAATGVQLGESHLVSGIPTSTSGNNFASNHVRRLNG
ncbi:unnamed protein product [Vitrella brassicaformis CCMP3155]|uniref:IPT/TIG domain-containing protein n=3 Tax=Vitrella brassicaformis TaxID=1169539 RepID=A0A0G4EFC4_VITBC|nr:unnamed protein product [Vitrella brassicaformis CCMP3155]|eukprot:CEL94127.1 unnamed protein product [Vitrella brassicaformis CCMP3155]